MLMICKISSHSAVDYAADEFKKYLRMMMPNGGDVSIVYRPDATEGFRIGLMQDFGLDVSDVQDTELDDLLYIDTTETGGIVAGDNPRSVLMAVYEFFRQNGCRWLFPGVDGEYIPMKPVRGVTYRHAPSCRYRGPCIEGGVSQQVLLETIDFLPKVGMNLFMSQFLIPTAFYNSYYKRPYNTVLKPEPLTADTMLQWKVWFEAELSRRGLQFHDVGHGWTAVPFGVDISTPWAVTDEAVPFERAQYLAEIDGERKLFRGVPINTQFCMSNPQARRKVAACIADYAKQHTNVDYLHVWLADQRNNHCECETCIQKLPSDWYVMLLNDIDEALTAEGLHTRIVFIAYNETVYAPTEARIKNPDRFTLMLAPIMRHYTRSMSAEEERPLPPFLLNRNEHPTDLYLSFFKEWKRVFPGAGLCFEYYFWKHQMFDLSGLALAKRIYEDIEVYRAMGLDGLIACGSQRSYFPNGFAYYVFARKQFDLSLTYEELQEDYYSHAYGEDWREVAAYLQRLGDAFGFAYLEGEESEDEAVSPYRSQARAARLAEVSAIAEEGRRLLDAHGASLDRVKTVSRRLLETHGEYACLLAEAMKRKAEGKDREAEAYLLGELADYVSQREYMLERYYDLELSLGVFRHIMRKKNPNFIQL